MSRVLAAAIVVAFASVVGARASTDPPAGLRITSPTPGRPASGIVTLRAEPEADFAGRVSRVTFRVDGRVVCSREAPPFECEWDAGPEAVHVVRAAADLTDGGRLVASLRTASGRPSAPLAGITVNASVEVVQVAATVIDGHGRFVGGLRPTDFHVFEDDAPQQVSQFFGEDAPREVVVAVDMSASMTPAMPKVRTAVRAFLAALRPEDQVTVLAFNDAIFTLARRETEPDARQRAVGRLAPWGGTALYDVILKAMDMLAARHGRKVLVVFTDGEDQSSRSTFEEVQLRAGSNDAPVYLIGQGRGASDPFLRASLDRLAAVSGGRVFHTEDPRELQGVFTQIEDEISHQYLLGYQPTNADRDSSWRRIRVAAGAGRNVRARQGYRAVPRPDAAGGVE